MYNIENFKWSEVMAQAEEFTPILFAVLRGAFTRTGKDGTWLR